MVSSMILSLVRRIGVFQTAPSGDPEVEDPVERFCLWVPIVFTVAVLRWVTKRISKRIKKCKWPWKIFCWIVAIIVIVILVLVLVIVTIVWWVYICGRELEELGREE
ncbi:hypothetical protein [Haladaptatus sp. NG-SE-30]